MAVVGEAFINLKSGSADEFTRDANGQIIPLSERFNPESNSILYAPERPSTGDPDLDDALEVVNEPISEAENKPPGGLVGAKPNSRPIRVVVVEILQVCQEFHVDVS